MSGARPRRVMIIGFDGATLDLIRPWAQAGYLPTFRRLMREGSWGTLRTTIPPLTPTAWTSFATGMNPGKHGLLDFTRLKADSYDTTLVDATMRGGPALWQLLSEAGRRVIVFNVPVTYPPDRVNGLMVSGLLTPASATNASWPPELLGQLKEAVPGFTFSTPGIYSRGQDARFVRSVRSLLQTTLESTRYLMQEPWDCLVSIFMSIDIVSHFMWKHMETAGALAPEPLRPVLGNAIRDCYQDADSALAELLEAAGPESCTIVISDHGFGPMAGYMSVNAWLLERGYLRLKRSLGSQFRYRLYRTGFTPLNIYGLLLKLGMGESMRRTSRRNIGLVHKIIQGLFPSLRDVDWSRTTAYSIGYGGVVFVNLEGRQPQGIVRPGAPYEALVERISADLRDLRDPGTSLPFVGAIHRGRDLYHGPHAHRAPDLIFEPRDPRIAGLGLVEFPSNRWLAPSPDRSGFHRMNGILFMAGPGIRRGLELEASILDIAPTALALLGVPVPPAMDGRVLTDAFTPELQEQMELASTGRGLLG